MFATVPTAIRFHQHRFGSADAVFGYTHNLVVAAGVMLADAWATQVGQPLDSAGSLLMVQLPVELGSTCEDLAQLAKTLKDCSDITVWSAGTLGDDGKMYLRLSCAVYNAMSDFELLRDAVLHITSDASMRSRI